MLRTVQASIASLTIAALMAASTSAGASDLPGDGFALPLDCSLGWNCWIVNLPDTSGSPPARDFKCGDRTYSEHRGTDFAVPDFASLDRGVSVLSAADGVVSRVRDGMPDIFRFTEETRDRLKQTGCGNGVVVDHGGGWESQYCHLREGSVSVRPGDRVRRGDKLGLVGMSGRTAFPHVHLVIRENGTVVDPFTGRALGSGCGVTGESLWRRDAGIKYPGPVVYAAGIAGFRPTQQHLLSSVQMPQTLPRHGAELVLWATMYGVKPGDVLTFRLFDPDGKKQLERKVPINRAQARRLAYVGRKLPPLGWKAGRWKGEVTLSRKSEAGSLRQTRESYVTVK